MPPSASAPRAGLFSLLFFGGILLVLGVLDGHLAGRVHAVRAEAESRVHAVRAEAESPVSGRAAAAPVSARAQDPGRAPAPAPDPGRAPAPAPGYGPDSAPSRAPAPALVVLRLDGVEADLCNALRGTIRLPWLLPRTRRAAVDLPFEVRVEGGRCQRGRSNHVVELVSRP